MRKEDNLNDYLNFKTTDAAAKWASKYYLDWYPNDHNTLINPNTVSGFIKMYCGWQYRSINELLRNMDTISDLQTRIMAGRIIAELGKFTLQENIIVYRLIDRNSLEQMANKSYKHIYADDILLENGIMSTSLVLASILKEHQPTFQSVILKIYLPKGSYGAYVDFLSRRQNEQEFMIPPKIQLRVIKKQYIKYPSKKMQRNDNKSYPAIKKSSCFDLVLCLCKLKNYLLIPVFNCRMEKQKLFFR